MTRLLAVLLGLLAATSWLAAQDIIVTDADERRIVLNQKGQVTLVVVCTEDSEDTCREAGRLMDPYHGTEAFRHRVVVDLRDSWGSMVESLVKSQMRDGMDDEAERLKAVYKAKGCARNPRQDLSATPDVDGTITKKLGFEGESIEEMRAVLFDRNGKVIGRWDKVTNPEILVEPVGKALKK